MVREGPIDNRMQLMGCKRGRPRPAGLCTGYITAILRGRYIYLIRGVVPCGARPSITRVIISACGSEEHAPLGSLADRGPIVPV